MSINWRLPVNGSIYLFYSLQIISHSGRWLIDRLNVVLVILSTTPLWVVLVYLLWHFCYVISYFGCEFYLVISVRIFSFGSRDSIL